MKKTKEDDAPESFLKITHGVPGFLDFEAAIDFLGAAPGKAGKLKFRNYLIDCQKRGLDVLDNIPLPASQGLKKASRVKLETALERIRDIARPAAAPAPCGAVDAVKTVCERAGLGGALNGEGPAGDACVELLDRAKRHGGDITEFFDSLALDRDEDRAGPFGEKVTLMTLHAAKGLEFPVVFVAGCEDGLIPFARDGETVEDMEEERRLFYVAMTRAKDLLHLSHCTRRKRFGAVIRCKRSPFINDIEKKYMREERMQARKQPEKPRQMDLFQT